MRRNKVLLEISVPEIEYFIHVDPGTTERSAALVFRYSGVAELKLASAAENTDWFIRVV